MATTATAVSAKPKCGGKAATIVGTAKGEVIRGTNKADVIVARGGHDKIYGRGGADTICGGTGHDKIVGAGGWDIIFGGPGRDKLYGGTGRDRLLGGPANDRLAGGPGNDACLQGAGTGVRLSCERPVVMLPPPPPPPKVLAIAYSDLVRDYVFGPGDVLISKYVDANLDGTPSVGDTIVMDQYPSNHKPGPTKFRDWGRKSHVVTSVKAADRTLLSVDSASGSHEWREDSSLEEYIEWAGVPTSRMTDVITSGGFDLHWVHSDSPSQPSGSTGLVTRTPATTTSST